MVVGALAFVGILLALVLIGVDSAWAQEAASACGDPLPDPAPGDAAAAEVAALRAEMAVQCEALRSGMADVAGALRSDLWFAVGLGLGVLVLAGLARAFPR